MAVLRARLVFTFGSFWRLAAWKWGAGSPTFARGGAESPQLCAGVEVLCSAPFHRQTLMRASFRKQVWGLPGLRESRVGGAVVAPGRGLAAGPFPGVPSLPGQCWGEAVSGPRCGFWPLWRLRPWRGVPGSSPWPTLACVAPPAAAGCWSGPGASAAGLSPRKPKALPWSALGGPLRPPGGQEPGRRRQFRGGHCFFSSDLG